LTLRLGTVVQNLRSISHTLKPEVWLRSSAYRHPAVSR
jgi:hypothetical protein